MAATFVLPGSLRPLAGGQDRIRVEEPLATVGDALRALFTRHPALRDRVLTEEGMIRPHVNVFVGDLNVRDASGLATAVPDGVEISIIAAVSGGRMFE